MNCDQGRLRAYADNALLAEERLVVERHLDACESCRDDLAAARQTVQTVASRLESLDPGQLPDAAAALKHFRAVLAPQEASRTGTLRNTLKWRVADMKRTLWGRWRPAAVGLMVLAMLVGIFSIAPVREAAADFLGVFRVRKFAVIPIDTAQLAKLEGVGQTLDAGVLGEPVFTRQPTDPQAVGDVGEASVRAGFAVRVPGALPSGALLSRVTVAGGPAARWEIDRATLQAILDGFETDVTLPQADQVVAEVDIANVVEQSYRIGEGTLSLWQVPSPTLAITPDLDPAVLGEALLRFLGLPADEASRLADGIDWSSTLVIPLPADLASAQEVDVDGAAGLWLQVSRESPTSGPQYALLWQRDGIVYGMQSTGVRQMDVMRAADSLH